MIIEPAPAKINLALHVRRRRADGYHDIETLFAFCADGDEVRVRGADQNRFEIIGPFASALKDPHPSPLRGSPSPGGRGVSGEQRPALFRSGRGPDRPDTGPAAAGGGKGEGDGWSTNNLVVRAALGFTAAFGIRTRHAITLDKRLPVAAGIGGGSADAAATLRALARLHDISWDDPRLATLAASLGADVPACLDGRTAFGTGRGDALTTLEGLAGAPVLLVNPGIPIATAAVFARWDGIDRGPVPDGPLLDRARTGRNDLEPPARLIAPVIGDVLDDLAAAAGATLSRMSGSGATCFALFEDTAARDAAAAQAAAQDWWTLATTLT